MCSFLMTSLFLRSAGCANSSAALRNRVRSFCFDRDAAAASAAAEFQRCQPDQGLVPPTRPPRFEGTQGGNRGGEAKRKAARFTSSGPSVAKRNGREQGACISKFYLRTHVIILAAGKIDFCLTRLLFLLDQRQIAVRKAKTALQRVII